MRFINSFLIIAALLESLKMPVKAASVFETLDLPSLAASSDDGSNSASFGGPVGASSNVFITNYVVLAWANAGIDANWLPQRNWNNTFLGTSGLAIGSPPAEAEPQRSEPDYITLATNESHLAEPWTNNSEAVTSKYRVPVDPALLFLPDNGAIASRGAHLNSSAFAIFDSDFIPTDQQQYWQLVAAVFAPEMGGSLELPPAKLGSNFDATSCWPSEKKSISSGECKIDLLSLEEEDQSLFMDIFPERIAIAVMEWDSTSGPKFKTLALISLAAPFVLLLRRRRIVRPAVRRIPTAAPRRVPMGKCA